MTVAQRFLKEDLDDAQRVARLRTAAVSVEDRTYSIVWTMRDGSRVERGCARGVAAYGTLPSVRSMIERTLKADRETVTYFRRCEAQARLRAKRTGSAAWDAAAAEWVMARFHTEADIRRHLRELIRLRQGAPSGHRLPARRLRGAEGCLMLVLPKTTAEVLEGAARLIEAGWCRFSTARTDTNAPCAATSNDAVCWCASGAIAAAARRLAPPDQLETVTEQAQRAMVDAILETHPDFLDAGTLLMSLIASWNDHAEIGPEHVVGRLRRAGALLRQPEAA